MDPIQDVPMLINAEAHSPKGGAWIDSTFPYTQKTWCRIPRGTAADADTAVSAAVAAFEDPRWAGLTPTARGKLLYRLADLFEAKAEEFARLEVMDNGKRITEMLGQMRRIPDWYRYFAGLADKVEGAVLPNENQAVLNITRPGPLGVIVCITPWNSPLLLAAYKLAPALAAGNTIILKPSEFTSASSLAFGQLFDEAGFPPGVVNVVTGYGQEIGEALVTDKRIAKVSFTGGEAGGRAVYRAATEHFHEVALELGGKSPNIVFPDADLENASNGVLAGIFAATGQTCIAGSRLLVHRNIYDDLVERLIEKSKNLKMGDPLDPATQVAPVATAAQHAKILEYMEIARSEGATCVLGGGAGQGASCGDGLFVQPTIFTGVTNSMRIAREEVFGPVLSVISFEDEDDAIAIANDTDFGLAAGLWTQDLSSAVRLSDRLRAGTVWVNTYRAVSYTSPFGGVKQSGIGRENGMKAIEEFMSTKSIWFNTAPVVPNPFA
ncbi:aldehyde dehydrogenase [uncultured Tateyamaria sp.]|uniref:aldehyde dehydrogenase n=1 Tax=uncultured Tateyamaria sp. TaxID=455651 RepID=UPI00263271F9|nr:aldehyde dehydrogenase [uncultured Tateyamaria sp.]